MNLFSQIKRTCRTRVYALLASENQNNDKQELLCPASISPDMSPWLSFDIGQIKLYKSLNLRQFMALNSITFWDYRFVGERCTSEHRWK